VKGKSARRLALLHSPCLQEGTLYDRITSALVWVASFCLAIGVFLSITLLFRSLPPTEPVAVGLVTILRYSKFRDYLGAALFFLLVPPLTIWLRVWLARGSAWAAAGFRKGSGEHSTAAGLLFAAPFLLSPIFFLTTGKAGWVLLLPLLMAFGGPWILSFARRRRWLRELFRPEMGPFHALLFSEALAWILFRYLVTTRRIGHIPTLFLEALFVALFMALFWVAALLIARQTKLAFGHDEETTFRRVTTALLPIVVLPFLAAALVPMPQPRLFMVGALAVAAIVGLLIHRPLSATSAWRLAALLIIPALLYLFSYGSTAQHSQWVDLFHRGESIGPASDYLRGKVPFRDVFALHGMLEDGQLDAWLMQIFGRSLEVAVARSVIVGAFLGVAIWFLGLAVFRSIPLALICVAMGSWTTAENSRTFFQVAAVALFWIALRKSNRFAAAGSGVFAGVALFFSYDIGLYTIAGAFAASLLLWISSRRVAWTGLPPHQAAIWFAGGVLAGGAPFAAYLARHGALGDFFVVSFRTIPGIIDAVWSLPFPDLVSTFRKDLTLQTLADFIIWEKFHLIVSPLTIAIAAVYFIHRWLQRRVDLLDHALLVMTVFATVAQRTAFGRASFRHQYFAAFLIGPLIVLLILIAVRTMRRTWDQGGEGTRAFLATLVIAALPIAAALFWIPELVDARLNDFTRYYHRLTTSTRDHRAEEVYWRINDVSSVIRELTGKDEPIFDFSNQPAFYFFADRPNPTRFYQVPILSPPALQKEAIAALEVAKPKVILRRSPEQFDQFDGVTNDLRAQAVAAYIDDNYRFHRSVRGVELWTREQGTTARSPESYLAAIRLPDPKELVSAGVSRMVFPAVGSVAGAGGAYWQSDLTMHNPFREPISVTLRFVTEGRGIDRGLTLQPRQTLRAPNVIRNHFAIEGKIGTLWLEHREGRAPVAVVKTADVAHHANASIERPLTRRDAASAASAVAELAIVGIPAPPEAGRRINVGLVNIGIIPATFRVSIRTARGDEVGRAVESGVAEDHVWMVHDLERELGTAIDETMTVQINVIAGTGVGFATIVTSSGDAEFIAAIPAEAH
jgi:hypothetical protein